jgi:hypothetical protein
MCVEDTSNIFTFHYEAGFEEGGLLKSGFLSHPFTSLCFPVTVPSLVLSFLCVYGTLANFRIFVSTLEKLKINKSAIIIKQFPL